MVKMLDNILEAVGSTPLVKLNRVTRGIDATIAMKCEFFNPLGSVKDRIGLAMIERAEAEGRVGSQHRAGRTHQWKHRDRPRPRGSRQGDTASS